MDSYARTRAGEPELVLDLSRLISRMLHQTPTGVDRVEMAYARELGRRVPERLAYAAIHPMLGYGRLPQAAVDDFLNEAEVSWEAGRPDSALPGRRLSPRVAARLLRLRPRRTPPPLSTPRIYIQSSPHHLHQTRLVNSILRRERARFVCLLHDLIPIEYPEYARPGGAITHDLRMRTVAKLADAVIANSEATRQAFLPYLLHEGRNVPVVSAHLGLPMATAPSLSSEERPYFVCLGTIEPRKNHLLLLHIWRDLSERFGVDSIPRLLIIGRRGWENEQVIDLLERSRALVGCVEEHAMLPDARVLSLIAGARALLLPSFAEGYGMPVPEALALGVPVICSDIPALREAGGDAALYLNPLDGIGWRNAIMAMASPDGKARAHRIAAIENWRAPSWARHFDIVLEQVALIEKALAD